MNVAPEAEGELPVDRLVAGAAGLRRGCRSFGEIGSQSSGGGQGQPFGGGNFGGFRRGIDEDTLKQVANLTGGAYYPAATAGELQHVFQNLPIYLVTQHETMEISVWFTAAGVLLAALAILLSFI